MVAPTRSSLTTLSTDRARVVRVTSTTGRVALTVTSDRVGVCAPTRISPSTRSSSIISMASASSFPRLPWLPLPMRIR